MPVPVESHQLELAGSGRGSGGHRCHGAAGCHRAAGSSRTRREHLLVESGLDYGDFEDANLSGAKIGYAFLYGADFTGANLTGANLGGVFLSGAIFTGVTWSDTVCPDYTNSDSDGGTCINDL